MWSESFLFFFKFRLQQANKWVQYSTFHITHDGYFPYVCVRLYFYFSFLLPSVPPPYIEPQLLLLMTAAVLHSCAVVLRAAVIGAGSVALTLSTLSCQEASPHLTGSCWDAWQKNIPVGSTKYLLCVWQQNLLFLQDRLWPLERHAELHRVQNSTKERG